MRKDELNQDVSILTMHCFYEKMKIPLKRSNPVQMLLYLQTGRIQYTLQKPLAFKHI